MAVSVRVFGGALGDYAVVARAADRLGFHGLWVPDHVVAMSQVDTVYPYSPTGRPRFAGATPFADPVVMLGHLAAVTERIRLGVGVFVLPLRHPLHAARQLMTAHELARGRLVLGVGVGWNAEEFAALGARFDRRGARAEEMVDVMRKVWTGEPTSYAGRHHDFSELQISPPLSHPLPVLWGGSSDVSVRRAVRMADGLYGPPGDLADSEALCGHVQRELAQAGRERASFHLVSRCPEPYDVDAPARLLDLGIDEVVLNIPRELVEPSAQIDWLETTATALTARGLSLA